MQSLARDEAGSSARSVMETPAMASSEPDAKMTPASSETLAGAVAPAVPAPVKKGTVRFDSSLRIRPIPGLSFVSDEEKGKVWYYEDEISSFAETIRLDVRHVRQLAMRQAKLSPGHNINGTHDESCSRGIEHFATRDTFVRRETAKAALIESVLREQKAHLSATMPSVDAADGASEKHSDARTDALKDAIAQAVCDVSTRLSLEARSRAATLGASDRAFAAAEESSLRAMLASHNLASPTAQTDVLYLATRGNARARSSSSAEPTDTTGSTAAGSSSSSPSPSSSLKRSACSVPNLMNYAASHHGPSTSAAMVHAYEQVAAHRRRRLSLLRDSLLASMVVSDSNTTQHSQQDQQQQHRP